MTLPTLPSTLADAQRNLAAAQQLAADQALQLAQARAQAASYLSQVTGLSAQVTSLQAQLAALRRPPLPAGWSTVTFFDGFDGPLDPGVWQVLDQVGLKRDQAWLTKGQVAVRDSCLVITAANLPTAVNGRTVASGAVSTMATPGIWQRAGRFEICAALPTAPALWSAGWLRDPPAVGELDIFEAVGLLSPIVQTAHQDTSGLLDHLGFDWQPPASWTREVFHVYAIEWDADKGNVRWYVDDLLTRTVTPATVAYPSGKPAAWLTGPAYSMPMALLLNLQVGGAMSAYYGKQVVNPAQLDGTAQAQLRVDWVRMLSR